MTNVVFRWIRTLWNLGMPQGAPPRLRDGCRAMLAATIPLWALGFLGASQDWGWGTMSLVHDGAVTTALGALICWCTAFIVSRVDEGRRQRERDQADWRALIRQNGDLWCRIPEGDRPSLLREASGR